jgi:hypothetical protein
MTLGRSFAIVSALLAGCSSLTSTVNPEADGAADVGDDASEVADDTFVIALPHPCSSAAECAASEVCAYPVGSCTGSSVCVTRRAEDGGTSARRYCGCDGSAVDAASAYPDGWAQVPTRGVGVCPGGGADGGASCIRRPAAGCPTTPCPDGTVCAYEIGGVAGGGGSWCLPIPGACATTPTCACMGLCACGTSAGRAEACADATHGAVPVLACDNGVR